MKEWPALPEDDDLGRADALLDQADALLRRHRGPASRPPARPAPPPGRVDLEAHLEPLALEDDDDLPILTDIVEDFELAELADIDIPALAELAPGPPDEPASDAADLTTAPASGTAAAPGNDFVPAPPEDEPEAATSAGPATAEGWHGSTIGPAPAAAEEEVEAQPPLPRTVPAEVPLLAEAGPERAALEAALRPLAVASTDHAAASDQAIPVAPAATLQIPRMTAADEQALLISARAALIEELVELDTEIARSVEAWLVEELPPIVARELDSLAERIRIEALAQLRATLLPSLSERIAHRIDKLVD